MTRKATPSAWVSLVCLGATMLCGCAGSGYSTGAGPSVGVGFYHSTYGHSWGGGYYRGYNRGAADAVETIETLDTIETIDAIDSMGMPGMDMDIDLPDIDLDF